MNNSDKENKNERLLKNNSDRQNTEDNTENKTEPEVLTSVPDDEFRVRNNNSLPKHPLDKPTEKSNLTQVHPYSGLVTPAENQSNAILNVDNNSEYAKQREEQWDRVSINYLDNLKKALRTKSSALKCPFCKKSTETEVTKKCSAVNILCFIFTTPIFWAFFKCCRGKDCNFYDANHKCKKCMKEIADYSAC